MMHGLVGVLVINIRTSTSNSCATAMLVAEIYVHSYRFLCTVQLQQHSFMTCITPDSAVNNGCEFHVRAPQVFLATS